MVTCLFAFGLMLMWTPSGCIDYVDAEKGIIISTPATQFY